MKVWQSIRKPGSDVARWLGKPCGTGLSGHRSTQEEKIEDDIVLLTSQIAACLNIDSRHLDFSNWGINIATTGLARSYETATRLEVVPEPLIHPMTFYPASFYRFLCT